MRAGNSLDSDRHQGSDQSRHQGDVYRRIEVITGTVRRRRWTTAEKAQILMESLTPDAQVSEVARRHDLTGSVRAHARVSDAAEHSAYGHAFCMMRSASSAPSEKWERRREAETTWL
ncbi:MAG: transposase [Janthinobacterium lividum]